MRRNRWRQLVPRLAFPTSATPATWTPCYKRWPAAPFSCSTSTASGAKFKSTSTTQTPTLSFYWSRHWRNWDAGPKMQSTKLTICINCCAVVVKRVKVAVMTAIQIASLNSRSRHCSSSKTAMTSCSTCLTILRQSPPKTHEKTNKVSNVVLSYSKK